MSRCAVPRAGLLSEAASDQWLLYTVLTAAASIGYRLGVTTRLGRLATGPICAMGLTFVAAGTGALPPASAQVSAAQGLAVRIATPLLLFGANLRAIASRAGRLLPSFMLGTLGTALGTLPMSKARCGSDFSQLALPRPSLRARACLGCPRLRPASANQPLRRIHPSIYRACFRHLFS